MSAVEMIEQGILPESGKVESKDKKFESDPSAARMIYLQGCATEHLGQKEAVNLRYGTQRFPPP